MVANAAAAHISVVVGVSIFSTRAANCIAHGAGSCCSSIAPSWPRPERQRRRSRSYVGPMCRNITTLRGLEPQATADEIEAGARQYVRKISGVQKTSAATEEAFEHAVAVIAAATTELLAELPPRKQPPKTEPPLRRIARG